MKRFSQKLYVKLALSIAFVAAVVAAISSYYFYFDRLEQQHASATEQLHQLAGTVEKTASIAVYVQDAQLAFEIVEGLAINSLVAQAQLLSTPGFSVHSGPKFLQGREGLVSETLFHPFDDKQVIGKLMILPNEAYISHSAAEAALKQAQMSALLILIMALMVSYIVHKTLTSPLKRITDKFAEVTPGENIEIPVPRFHQHDEIGSLVKGINSLILSLNHSIESERQLRHTTEILEKQFRLIFEQASAGICLIDDNNLLVTANPAFEKIFFQALTVTQAIGLDLTEWFENQLQLEEFLIDIRQDKDVNTVAVDLKLKTAVSDDDCWLHCLFSKVIDADEQSKLIIEVLMYDVTERTEREINTRFEADHDALTHLKNRRAGERMLNELIDRAIKHNKLAVIMNIDLDKFKIVNDVHGHESGDAVLIEVGKRLKSVFRNDDLCIRWGGDEFVVGCYFDNTRCEDQSMTAIEKLCVKLRDTLNQDICLPNGMTVAAGASIGVSICPEHGNNLEEAMSVGDIAMYISKEEGRNRYTIYHEGMTGEVAESDDKSSFDKSPVEVPAKQTLDTKI